MLGRSGPSLPTSVPCALGYASVVGAQTSSPIQHPEARELSSIFEIDASATVSHGLEGRGFIRDPQVLLKA